MRRQPEGLSYYTRLPFAIARHWMMPLALLQPTQSVAVANDDDTGSCNCACVSEATEAAIRALSEVKPKLKLAQPPDQCVVCLTDYDAEDKLRAMPCAHAFHEQCIFRWLRRNAACPLCRHELPRRTRTMRKLLSTCRRHMIPRFVSIVFWNQTR
ncbi:hypothetical protein PR202_gb16528 [Eleusine coracana subsp. coracana]|uniref:RING-type domain-containing protein n=1 Tax=Eleusine coracana subsp. coracana TaxID=191504 RepID=A0AAV5F270_ELECO|nr:hypothetical protein PR202_gb16528 [Eleusine coracana subsp. coracana]